MTRLTCDELRGMAAEVALGILSGAERGDALGHMEHCVSCRVLVEGLAQTGDSLLLLAPEADPPIGFESRVAARVREGAGAAEAPLADHAPTGRDAVEQPERPAPPTPIRSKSSTHGAKALRWRRTALVAAAAAAVFAGGTAAAVTVIDHSSVSGHTQAANQTALRSGQFHAPDGRPVGRVYAYSGSPAWVFMNVDAAGASGTYTCELELTDGSTVPVGEFDVHNGVGEWAHTVSVDVTQVKAAKLVEPSGETLATATVS